MRLLLLLALVLLQQPTRLYLPGVQADPAVPRKGLAGHASAAQRLDIGATWYHHWSLCGPNEGPQCVDVSKGFAFWDLYGEGEAEIAAALERCTSGWFLVGDEWVLQGKPLLEQVVELRWYLAKRDEVNPDCRIAFGGILTFHPNCDPRQAAYHWLPAFYGAFWDSYGHAPDIQALVFDDYYWAGWFYLEPGHPTWADTTEKVVDRAHDLYGDDIEIWAREIGSLRTHHLDPSKYPRQAMERLPQITPFYDRYAWFISQSSGAWDYTALWVDGELTELGEMYRDYDRPLYPWGPD